MNEPHLPQGAWILPHGCRIHARVLVGIGAIVLDGVDIETGAIAGSRS